MAAAMARRLLAPSSASRPLSASFLCGRSAAVAELLRPTAATFSSSFRLGGTRGMARRPGGDSYSPMRSGGGGGRAPTEMAPLFPGCDYEHWPGCDHEHWMIVMDKPGGEGATKQQMIDCYIQTLAKVLGSEEEAKKKIYKVSCERYLRPYFAFTRYKISLEDYLGFGCEIDEETSNKLEGLPGVLVVMPDAYINREYKDYGAELFVNGEIVQRPPERQWWVTESSR